MNYCDKILSIMTLLLVKENLIGYCVPKSPCQNVFSYMYHNQNWYGEIKIYVPNKNARLVHLEVKYFLRRKIQQQEEGSINITETADEISNNIRNGIPLTFLMKFPFPEEPPMIDQIILNDEIICVGPFDDEAILRITIDKNVNVISRVVEVQVKGDGSPIQPPVSPTIFKPNTTPPIPPTPYPRPPPRPTTQRVQTIPQSNDIDNRIFTPLDPENICGVKSNELAIVHLIANGEVAEKQPWLVALFDNNAEQPIFFCAASLISNNFVITAAHCTIDKKEIILKLGGADISTLHEKDTIIRFAAKIFNHPNYQRLSSNADIALIKMTEPVKYNNNFKPVCLWPNSHLEENFISGQKATIIGWGNDENGHLTVKAPKQTNLIIKPYDECKRMDLLNEVISDKTICAAGANSASGPCLGDSGGGLYMYIRNKWTIRGIISAAIGKEGSRICDVEHYFSVYTDTGKYFEWINYIVYTE